MKILQQITTSSPSSLVISFAFFNHDNFFLVESVLPFHKFPYAVVVILDGEKQVIKVFQLIERNRINFQQNNAKHESCSMQCGMLRSGKIVRGNITTETSRIAEVFMQKHCILFLLKQLLEPLPSLIMKETITENDVLECKRVSS